jgi:hypothetical protein
MTDKLADRIAALPADERAIMDALLERLEKGREVYGPWRVDDDRDYRVETWEEIIDALHYCAALIVRDRGEGK